MSVITTAYYVVIIFHRQVWYLAISLRYACIRSFDIILTLGYLGAKFSFFRGHHCCWKTRSCANAEELCEHTVS